jgi:hypothetical protein
MGIDPRDLGALEKAVNDAAGRASNLWISFVFFATLIARRVGSCGRASYSPRRNLYGDKLRAYPADRHTERLNVSRETFSVA